MGKKKIIWVDYAKGIGILLVVFGHVQRGLINASLLSRTPLVDCLDRWIYSFHMPLFFVLSGLFCYSSAEKSVSSVLLAKLSSLAYPYFLWSIIQTSIQILLSPYTNNSKSIEDAFQIIYKPVMQFWFLYVLFILVLIVYFLLRIRIPAMAILILSLLGYIAPIFINLGDWGVVYQATYFFPYIAIGVFISAKIHPILEKMKAFQLIVGFSVCIIIVSIFVFADISPNRVFKLIPGTAGTIAVFFLSQFFSQIKVAFILQKIGKHSLEIYVAHTLASAGTRIILQKVFHIHSASMHLSLGMLIGCILPMIMVYFFDHVGFKYAFTVKHR